MSDDQSNYTPDYKLLFKSLSNSYETLREYCIDKNARNCESMGHKELYYPELPVDFGEEISAISACGAERDVFVFSIINWDFRFQRPQHLATELSQKTRVFYIEMELSPVGNLVRKINENLYVVRLPMQQVGMVELYSGLAKKNQIAAWIENFYKFVDDVSSTAQKSVIIQHPWWWQFTRHVSPEFQITFDCMDDISGFSNTTNEIIELEHDLVENCDHLVVSSDALYNITKEKQKPILVRNGCALEHFYNADEKGFILEGERVVTKGNRINVGYVGALAEWFDIELMHKVISADSTIEYHICGSVTYDLIWELDEYENVKFYGEIPYDTVPGFISDMDVMIIPFKLTPIIQACDPVKFYEHCIVGVPTVATRMPELFRAGEIISLSYDAEDFLENIEKMHEVGSSVDFKDELKEYARLNSWERRANHLWERISSYPRVSVVLLNYGDPAWSLGAIHSLTENGGNYPNLEIIVVDNGSDEDKINTLKNGIVRSKSKADIEIVENAENLGFAKGNNVGIDASTGDYVVLLNNDTYVSPGAIFSLVSHLQKNNNVGAVGPLTNNIGNEAKLFVNYPDIHTMGKKAKRWLTGYRRTHTSLKSIAYFCVAFRASDLKIFGGLNEDYGRGMFEDDDHCNVIRQQGFDVVLAEDAFVHHHLSATFDALEGDKKKILFEKNKQVYEKRWGKWIPHVYREVRPDSALGKVDV